MKRISKKENESNSFHEIFYSILTAELDGSLGKYRAPQEFKLIAPSNDVEAVTLFLKMHSQNAHTYRVYEREITRLHMWAVMKAGIALSSMSLDHYRSYINFMSEPDDEWCGNRAPLGTPNWRPFQPKKYDANNQLIKPSISSLITAIGTINPFLDWLCKGGYLIGNPLSIIKSEFLNREPKTVRKVDKNSNYFDCESFNKLKKTLQSLPRQTTKEKHEYELKKILLSLIYSLNTKTSEISRAKMSNFTKVNGKWYWFVQREKSKEDSVLLNKEMLESLVRWRLHLNLSELPESNDNYPLIPPVNKSYEPMLYKGGLSTRRITGLLRELILTTSESIAKTNPDKAAHIQSATSHWIRYTKLREKVSLQKDIR